MNEATDDRHETPTERADRNWVELLQELRVVQTGVQILTGFLLTIPFQQRFDDLDRFQHVVYLVTFVLAVGSTALIIAPVSLHRILFREHKKDVLVRYADVFTQLGLCLLALAVTAVGLLVFDVVVGRAAGIIAATSVLGFFAVAWILVPVIVDREPSAMSTER